MRFVKLTLPVALLALTSCVSGCATGPGSGIGTLGPAVNLPAPPRFVGPCRPSAVKVGDAPNQAFDLEHAAWKECSRRGAAARRWYLRLRTYYAGPAKKKRK